MKNYIDFDCQGYDNVYGFVHTKENEYVAIFKPEDVPAGKVIIEKDDQSLDGFVGLYDDETGKYTKVPAGTTMFQSVTSGLRGTSKVRCRENDLNSTENDKK